ncbi:hypothetical protein HY632_04580 [Candidatus Uhrbacteria bacterium]|nr:hypothetical protein [Candidatus Uhrbacteria bacterium]
MADSQQPSDPLKELRAGLQAERMRREKAEAALAGASELLRRTSDLLHRAGRGTIDCTVAARAVTDATEDAIDDARTNPHCAPDPECANQESPAPHTRFNVHRSSSPTDTERMTKRRVAHLAMQKHDYAGALLLFTELAISEPDRVEWLLRIGDCQLYLAHHEAAASSYIVAAERYAAEGFFLKAVAVYKLLCQEKGWSPEMTLRARHRLAELYEELGLSQEACAQWSAIKRALPEGDPRQEEIERHLERLSSAMVAHLPEAPPTDPIPAPPFPRAARFLHRGIRQQWFSENDVNGIAAARALTRGPSSATPPSRNLLPWSLQSSPRATEALPRSFPSHSTMLPTSRKPTTSRIRSTCCAGWRSWHSAMPMPVAGGQRSNATAWSRTRMPNAKHAASQKSARQITG